MDIKMPTRMELEAAEAPQRIGAMLADNRSAVVRIARRIADASPRALMTCARGSSDHAATYLQYLAHLRLGLPAMSLPPSIASLYDAHLDLSDMVFVVISQSGQSPDLVAGAQWARRHGALVVAIVNDDGSPVAQASQEVLPLRAGEESSVAATKTLLASMAASAQLVADLLGDGDFTAAMDRLPASLAEAWELDWSVAAAPLAECQHAFIVGRGPGLPAASEIALKLKETSGVSSEGVSSAEIMHGPLGLLRPGTPVVVVGQNDESLAGIRALSEVLSEKQARVFAAFEDAADSIALPVVRGLDSALAPLAAVQSFYRLASGISVARGLDPDNPQHLTKVTETH